MRKFLIPLVILAAVVIFIYTISGRSSPKETIATLEELEEQFGTKNVLKLDGSDFFITYDSELVNEVSTCTEDGFIFLKIRTIQGEVEVPINLSRESYEKDNKRYIYGILTVDNVSFIVHYMNAYELVKNNRYLATDY